MESLCTWWGKTATWKRAHRDGGSRVGEDMVIAKGLQAGETVVTEGQLRLQPGSRVQCETPTAGAARVAEVTGTPRVAMARLLRRMAVTRATATKAAMALAVASSAARAKKAKASPAKARFAATVPDRVRINHTRGYR